MIPSKNRTLNWVYVWKKCKLYSVSTKRKGTRNLSHQIVKSNRTADLIRPRGLFELFLFYRKANMVLWGLSLIQELLQNNTDGVNLLWEKRTRGEMQFWLIQSINDISGMTIPSMFWYIHWKFNAISSFNLLHIELTQPHAGKLMYKPGILEFIEPVGSFEILRKGKWYNHKMAAMGRSYQRLVGLKYSILMMNVAIANRPSLQTLLEPSEVTITLAH